MFLAIDTEYLALTPMWESALYGSYLVIPLKHDENSLRTDYINHVFLPTLLTTTDICDNIKDMFNSPGTGKIGQVYHISREKLEHELFGASFKTLLIKGTEHEGCFSLLDSYLYVLNTQVSFLCLGIQYDQMQTLYEIVNPGFANLSAHFFRLHVAGEWECFSFEDCLCDFANKCGMQKFFDGKSSIIAESYVYTLALVPQRFPSIEVMRQATFNLHLMAPLTKPAEDDSEEDLRYVYAVKAQSLGSYRWGCCISSQTLSFVVADAEMDLTAEMTAQGQDGLPVAILALYEKYTCLRFTELLSRNSNQDEKYLLHLKEKMLRFQAYGTVSPANLSRWYNVKQIYSAMITVNDSVNAIADIDSKVRILSEHQQEIQQKKSDTVLGIIAVFGIVSIIDSMLSIVHTFSSGTSLDWITIGGTLLSLAVVTFVMLRMLKK